MELLPSKFLRVRQDGSIKLKLRATTPDRKVSTANASISTHRNVAVQTGEEAQEFRNPRTLTPSGTWRRRYRCKPYRGRASTTIPIAHNSTQEKDVQAEERKILSITSLQAQLQRIRQHREEKKKREEEHELQCFSEFMHFTKNEFEKAWSEVYSSKNKKDNHSTRRKCNMKKKCK